MNVHVRARVLLIFIMSLKARDNKACLVASHSTSCDSGIQELHETQFHMVRDGMSIPKGMMQKQSLTSDSLHPRQPQQDSTNNDVIADSSIAPALKQAAKEAMSEAKCHLHSAREMKSEMPKQL